MNRSGMYIRIARILALICFPVHGVEGRSLESIDPEQVIRPRTYEVFHDPEGKRTVDQIAGMPFSTINRSSWNEIPDANAEGRHWIRFPISGLDIDDREWLFYTGIHREVVLFVRDHQGEFRQYGSGDRRWESHVINRNLIAFRVDTFRDRMIYVGIVPYLHNYRTVFPKMVPADELHLAKLYPPDLLTIHRFKWFNILTYGAIAMMLAYILFKFLILRSPEYPAYIGYLSCLLLMAFKEWIITTEEGWSYHELSYPLYVTLSLVTYAFYLRFSSGLLNLRERNPGLHGFIRRFIPAMLGYALIDLILVIGFNRFYTMLDMFGIFQIILIGTSLFLVNQAYKLKDNVSVFFVTGSLSYIVGGLLFVVTQKIQEQSVNTDSIWMYPPFYYRTGALVEILFFSMGLAYKTNRAERERTILEARLEQEQRQRETDLAEARRLTIEEERNRVSRDLHDEVGMGLTRIRYMIESLKRKKPEIDGPEIEQINRESSQVIQTMHDIVWSLKTGEDSMAEFVSNMRGTVVEYLESHGLTLDFEVVGDPEDFMMSPLQKRNVLLVVRESLHNVVRHAGASKVNVTMDFSEGLLMRICDDGKGPKSPIRYGNGIANMRKRIEDSEGQFDWAPGPSSGICVTIQLKTPTHQ